jgi:hypothetical protein
VLNRLVCRCAENNIITDENAKFGGLKFYFFS